MASKLTVRIAQNEDLSSADLRLGEFTGDESWLDSENEISELFSSYGKSTKSARSHVGYMTFDTSDFAIRD